MSTAYHIVQQQVFDITFPEEEKAYDLQTRFSHLFYKDATPVMTEVFHRLIPGELVLRLDSLILDLGRIRDDRLERDFRERFREALEKELALALDEYTRRETPGRNKSLADLLEYFLTTGMLPWWAAGELLADPAEVIALLVRDDPAGLKGLLLDTGRRDYVRRRLVFQFPTTTIHLLVGTLEPDEAPFIFAYHSDIVHIQSAQRFFRQEVSEFEKHLWIFIFTYLLVDRGSNFNRKVFVKSTLSQMARQHNLEYGVLITLFFKALESTSATLVRHSALSGIIATLYYEEERPVEKNQPQSAVSLMMEEMNVIRHYLFHGNLSGLPVLYNVSALSEIFTRLVAQAPDHVYEMIRSISGQEGIWARIVHAFDEVAVQSLIRLREPDEAEFIFHYAKRLETLQRQKFLVKTDSSGFHHSVWELILAFLWTERGNVFNSRVFLEYNIRRLARRHQLSYRQLLAFLVQGIGQDIRSERDSSLFHFLAVLLKESSEAPLVSETSSHLIESTSPTNEISSRVIESTASLSKTSSSVTETQTSLSETSSSVTQPSSSVSEASSSVIETPTSLSEISSRVIESTASLSETSSSVTQPSSSVSEASSSVIETPTPLSKISSHLIESTSPTNEISSRVIESTASLSEPSSSITETPTSLSKTSFSVTETTTSLSEPSSSVTETQTSLSEPSSSVTEPPPSDSKSPSTIPGPPPTFSEPPSPITAPPHPPNEKPPVEAPPPHVSATLQNPLYIHNAGLILLHPLLPHFFGKVGLTEKNQFIHQAARHRAAHLLQFLADGKQEHPEQGLMLNKILCEIPVEDTLPLHIIMTDTEHEVANQLMEALRQQWAKMKNTSVEGLRISFFQRDGALTSVQDGWKMRVEQKGIDVLLQYLPWSWAMVRLPWMTKILYTEWI